MARWELLLDAGEDLPLSCTVYCTPYCFSTSFSKASDAGVEVYFPSEFGIDPTLALVEGKTPFPPAGFEEKAAHAVKGEQKGLKTYKVYTGMFLEGALSARNGESRRSVFALALNARLMPSNSPRHRPRQPHLETMSRLERPFRPHLHHGSRTHPSPPPPSRYPPPLAPPLLRRPTHLLLQPELELLCFYLFGHCRSAGA